MATERKEKRIPHPTIPHLYRIEPQAEPTAAQALFGHLPSAQQHREKEDERYKTWLANKEKWRR
jgi:hypothetical protein